ncbi:MAG: cob(I)yrinic acid a,c-diamide adenosyltransferase [Spirochaetales bacterium]|jgi:cob(I)alamin adenosyltransferase|nr:cob(I)yrinic acid a,c-diamide adenosyltransferase [Spirochaetales bacterium]
MGLLLVFTGDGKGKTTAALGQVFRALGHGWKCCVIQFLKSGKPTGESLFAAREELLDFRTLGLGFILPGQDREPHRQAALRAWKDASGALASGKYRLVVLDELTYLCSFGFLDPAELAQTLRNRPGDVHVVVTGRKAPRELLEAADLVTEMNAVKHPLDAGIQAQEGIEY